MGYKAYLKLTRAHTAPLEAVPVALGAVLAIGSLADPRVAMWTFFGVLYHLSGYGMNSLADWVGGYDKNDENKQHHPLNTGELTKRQAYISVKTLLVATVVYGVWMASDSLLAVVVLFIGASCGVLYNYTGKRTVFKPVPITIAHTTVFIIPYLSLGGEIVSPAFLFSVIFVFMWVFFQIAVSGEVKDLTQMDESNLLRHSGMVDILDDIVIISQHLRDLAYLSKIVMGLVVSVVFVEVGGRGNVAIFAGVLITALTLVLVSLSSCLLKSGTFNRGDRVNCMAKIELATIALFSVGFIPLIGAGYLLVVSLTLLWVATFNYLEWGTVIKPDV